MTLADVGVLRAGTVDVISETAERITPAGVASSSAVIHPTGTVFLSRTASVGFSAMMGRPMAVSQDFMTWTPGPLLSGRFLLHVLRGMRPRLLGLMYGSTHKTIYMPDLLALRTPLPPIERQRGVAGFLDRECDRIAAVVAAAERTASVLEEQQREAFDRLVVGLPKVPLRYLVDRIDQGWSPECDAHVAAPGEWGVLKVGCVNYGTFRPEEHKRLPDDLAPRPELEAHLGDLLMSRANTRELVGSAAVVEDLGGWRLMLCDKTFRLRLSPGVAAGFVSAALASRACRDQIEIATAGASSSMQNISQATVRELQVPHADFDRQVTIESEVATHRTRLVAAQAVLSELSGRLREYREALIAEAVTGQLDISGVSDAQMNERAHAAADEGAVAVDRTPARVE